MGDHRLDVPWDVRINKDWVLWDRPIQLKAYAQWESEADERLACLHYDYKQALQEFHPTYAKVKAEYNNLANLDKQIGASIQHSVPRLVAQQGYCSHGILGFCDDCRISIAAEQASMQPFI
jgi:hypothetical protein